MSKPGPFKTFAVCKCGHHVHAPHGSLFHATIYGKVCQECGLDIEQHSSIVVSRWVDDTVLWKPSTWDKGHWEDKK